MVYIWVVFRHLITLLLDIDYISEHLVLVELHMEYIRILSLMELPELEQRMDGMWLICEEHLIEVMDDDSSR